MSGPLEGAISGVAFVPWRQPWWAQKLPVVVRPQPGRQTGLSQPELPKKNLRRCTNPEKVSSLGSAPTRSAAGLVTKILRARRDHSSTPLNGRIHATCAPACQELLQLLSDITLVQIRFGQTLAWTAHETSQCVRRLTQYPQEGRRQELWTISDDPVGTRGRPPQFGQHVSGPGGVIGCLSQPLSARAQSQSCHDGRALQVGRGAECKAHSGCRGAIGKRFLAYRSSNDLVQVRSHSPSLVNVPTLTIAGKPC
jgi:hypothetical protein